MGTSEPEAKQTSLVMGSENQTETSDGLKTHPATNSTEENQTAHEKKLSSSSSSSSCSSFEDPRTSPSETPISGHDKGSGDGISVSTTPVPGQEPHHSNAESATQSPTTQMMERPAEIATSPSYRIPAYVFTSKSSAANDWSVASNESLFSIHMGNMSFTKETANWCKSGEPGLGGDLTPSGPLSPTFDFTSKKHKSANNKSGEIEECNEAKAAETMREIIKDNEAAAGKPKSPARKPHHSPSFRRSDVSGASVKSFAFPILTGDHKTDFSHKKNASSPMSSQPQTPKVSTEPDTLQQKSQSGPLNPDPAPKSPSNAQSKWFSCLPCCSSRS